MIANDSQAASPPLAIARDLAYARRMIEPSLIDDVRGGDYERFLAIQLAPRDRRWALYAVTAFAIELARVAEIVSEPLIGHIRLAWWREALEEIIAGKKPRSHPVVLALAEIYAQTPAIVPHLLAMVEARAADLDPELIAEESAWQNYLDHTAGSLHFAWALLLDETAAQANSVAILREARGYATIGLLRAIPFHAAQGWVRFPATWLKQYALDSFAPSDGLNRFVAATCEALLQDGFEASHSRVLLPLTGIAKITKKHAQWLRNSGYNPYALKPKKLQICLEYVKLNIMQHRCF